MCVCVCVCVCVELYETVEQVGASMKQYVVEGMRNMWQQLNELARSHRTAEQQQMDVTKEEPDTPSSQLYTHLHTHTLPSPLTHTHCLSL